MKRKGNLIDIDFRDNELFALLKIGFAFYKLWLCPVFILEIKRYFSCILAEHTVEKS